MTVPSAINKSGPYTGNGVTTVFPYGFRILDASHIQVVRTEGGVDTILSSGFTVSGVGVGSGGNITFAVAPTALQKITLIRNAPFTQSTDLENQGAYYAETIEDALDLAAMRDQQMAEEIGRAVKVPVGQDIADFDGLISDISVLAGIATEVDIVAGIAADVDAVAGIAADVSTVADNLADVTNFADVYQGPKAVAPTLRNDGSPLQVGDLYFDTVEDRMKVRNGAAIWENAASSVNGTLNRQIYTATAGQTVFAVTYDVGFVDVWLNGVKLVGGGDDFTASNGTSITLTVGATLGDSVDIISFGAFAMADMLQKSLNLSDLPSPSAARVNLALGPTDDVTFDAVSAGSLARGAPVIKTADFTVAASENWLINNKSGSDCVVTLPAAAGATGREIMIQNLQALAVNSASSNVVPLAGGSAAAAILPGVIGARVTLVSDGTSWRVVDVWRPEIGDGQTWQNVGGSRALATTYTNTTGRPIQVCANIVHNGSGGASNFLVDGNIVSAVANNMSGTNFISPYMIIVPAGSTFRINQSAGVAAISTWWELR